MEDQDKINALAKLEDNWNGEGSIAPNDTAIEGANKVLDVLDPDWQQPDRIIPSAADGVCVCFLNGGRYTEFEILNNGCVLAIKKDLNGDYLSVVEIPSTRPEIKKALAGFERFLKRI